MSTIIFIVAVFIALGFGLINYLSIQDDIPDNLPFIKLMKPGSAKQDEGATRFYKGWNIYESNDKASVEFKYKTTTLNGPVEHAKTTFGLKCYSDGRLESTFDVESGVYFKTPDKSDKALIYFNGEASVWVNGDSSTAVKSNEPYALINKLLAKPSETVPVLYLSPKDTNNAVGLNIATDGLPELFKTLPARCRGTSQ